MATKTEDKDTPQIDEATGFALPHPKGPNAGVLAPGEAPRTVKAINWDGGHEKLTADATTLDIIAAVNKLIHDACPKAKFAGGAAIEDAPTVEEHNAAVQKAAEEQADAAAKAAKSADSKTTGAAKKK